jgi:hypothetical protein
MSHYKTLTMLKRKQTLIYLIIFKVGLFLHLLLWDQDFVLRLTRITDGWPAISSIIEVVWAFFMIYLVQEVGIWMVMMSLLLLFVILPILVRYRHVTIRPSPWLAVNVSLYLFLIMKLLGVY